MENVDNINNAFETKDLPITSYLYASGKVKLISTRKLQNREIYFIFSPRNIAENLVQQYWNLQAPAIQPKVLFSAMRDIKDLIFAG